MRGRMKYKIQMIFLLISFVVWILILYQLNDENKNRRILKEWANFQVGGYIMHSSCPRVSPNLIGATNLNFTIKPKQEEEMEEENSLVLEGGFYFPRNCSPEYTIAVIIPFRKRDAHLLYFLQYMHPLFQRKQMIYKIFVVNQYLDGPFNRAKLMNVGFLEAAQQGFNCFLFHDVDMILEDDGCPIQCHPAGPAHLGLLLKKFNYTARNGNTHLGGVALFSKDQYYKVNGMSNEFWGWGGEDDDLYRRSKYKGLRLFRSDKCRYEMISHDQEQGNILRYRLLKRPVTNYLRDGISSIKYKVVSLDVHRLYTNITVNLLDPVYGLENFDQHFSSLSMD